MHQSRPITWRNLDSIFGVMIHRLSRKTHERLSAEHADLTTRGRIMAAEKIARAREHGDLKENGDYHAAKDEHGHMEARIRQLESILENVEIVEPSTDGTVGVGMVVKVLYDGDDESMAESYLIGHIEEISDAPVMSPTSPLGSALLGAKTGDVVEYDAPNGKLKVKVLETRS